MGPLYSLIAGTVQMKRGKTVATVLLIAAAFQMKRAKMVATVLLIAATFQMKRAKSIMKFLLLQWSTNHFLVKMVRRSKKTSSGVTKKKELLSLSPKRRSQTKDRIKQRSAE